MASEDRTFAEEDMMQGELGVEEVYALAVVNEDGEHAVEEEKERHSLESIPSRPRSQDCDQWIAAFWQVDYARRSQTPGETLK